MTARGSADIVVVGPPVHRVALAVGAGGSALLGWLGAAGGEEPDQLASSVAVATEVPIAQAGADRAIPIALFAEAGVGYPGRPGLEGSRANGQGWAPRFTDPEITISDERQLVVEATDGVAGLTLATSVDVDDGGLVTIVATVTNRGADDYRLDGMRITVPVPDSARKVEAFTETASAIRSTVICGPAPPTRRPCDKST